MKKQHTKSKKAKSRTGGSSDSYTKPASKLAASRTTHKTGSTNKHDVSKTPTERVGQESDAV